MVRRGVFEMRKFVIRQDRCGMKVTSDGCAFGALATKWLASNKAEPKRILDIGTGTGLQALMCAQKFPEAVIDAVEIDPNAANQARDNAEPFENVTVLCTNALGFRPPAKYDAIVCNPPFFSRLRPSANTQSALARHDDTLPSDQLLDAVERMLDPAGHFMVLLAARFKTPRKDFEMLAADRGLRPSKAVTFLDNHTSHPHAVALTLRHERYAPRQTSEQIVFHEEPGTGFRAPTPQFRELMADFYLDHLLDKRVPAGPTASPGTSEEAGATTSAE